ncbi:MAG TPA: methyltransferase [Candidatus Baltobacteraceae bacterium]|nr:methyltransferase [Candidatus Baltobacteraceae bacterium]
MTTPPPWVVGVVTRVADALAKLRRRLIPRSFGVIELGTMSWVAQSLAAFCELRLPDALASGPRTADELSAQGYGDRDKVFRLLRALAAYDVVKYVGENRFALGHFGTALTGEHSAAPMILYANAPWHLAGYAQLAAGIRENRPGFDVSQGVPLFSYFEQHPQAGATFDAAMQSLTLLFAAPFAAAYDFSRMRHVVDVGGGTGVLLATVLQRFAHLRGTVFELPAVIPRVRTGERLDAAAGNILTGAPPAADAYIFSHILHDWDDESCVRMLRNVRGAMQANARVLVYEIVAPPPNNRWTQDRITDLEMLAMLSGRERTREEFAALFERAGLRLKRVIATAAPESILEALSHD